MPKKKVRHILGLSGGKDSAALALYLRDRIPDIEYFFCDTGCELTETYEFLNKLEARLHRTIKRLKSRFTFDQWLLRYDGFLPSAISRWCTVQLKIVPLEEFVGDDEAISYIGIRADEKRDGYISSKDNINPVYPFQEDGLIKEDIINILNDEGVGLPKYYEWRSRSGCYFCFFQRKIEWIRLSEVHPDLFEKAIRYESDHSDGRMYYWSEGEPLVDMLKPERKAQIIADYKKTEARIKKKPNQSLFDILSVLDEEEGFEPCSVCHL